MILNYYFRFHNTYQNNNIFGFNLFEYTKNIAELPKTTDEDFQYVDLLINKENFKIPGVVITNHRGTEIIHGYIPDNDFKNYGHGCILDSKDAVIIVFEENYLELYISNNNRPYELQLYQLLVNGDLDNEIIKLKNNNIITITS
ncbi:MAG: hypothetical protein KA369_05670 [Spirochaetes bacterium]|nr:hypothetical protein [Spirochaetota bacterium]